MTSELLSIWASLWIWLAALWVAFWQAFFINRIMIILWRNPKMTPFFLTLAILWIALVESAAIFWLIVALQLLSAEFVNPLASIWVGLAIWLTWLWVWVWEGLIVEEASKSINKNPDDKNKIMSFMILFIALVESVAIYGIIVSFQILAVKEITTLASLWSWLAVWLAWLGWAIWMWMISRKAIWVYADWQNEDLKMVVPFAILWIALVEAAVIYGLIVSLQIISTDLTKWILALWAWLAVWLAGLWVAIWQWLLVSNAVNKIWTPWVSWKTLIPVTVLGVALIEAWAIYGLIIAFQILSSKIWIWLNAIWAGLTIWLAWFGTWLWQGFIWYKAMEAISINKELKNKIITYLVLFIALVESVAIYGLVLAINILSKDTDLWVTTIWVWASMWLSAIWVWVWASILTWNILTKISKRPELTWFFVTIAVLWVALVESAAIYWLIVSFQILWMPTVAWFKWLAAWLSIWMAWLWVWFALSHIIVWASGAMERNPENKTRYLTFMILFVALVEVLAIYGLIIANQILK